MIEVPAAVYQIATLARQADFFCIGTNDLAQYLLATDRNNPRVSRHLDTAHPALLQVLQQIAGAARRADRPVTVCGEIACDPAMALVLLGMGLDRLSMNPAALPRVKWAIRQVSADWTRQLASQALACSDPAALARLLETVPAAVGLPDPAIHAAAPACGAASPAGRDAAGAG
jgi:phosphotransferase system enzyme I (PtsP)